MRVTRSLASRAAILAGSVAALAVIIAGIFALPLIRSAAEHQVRESLARQADLVQDVATNPQDFDTDHLHGGDNPNKALLGMVGYLQAQGIQVQAIVPGVSVPSTLSVAQINVIAQGKNLSEKVCHDDNVCEFAEARPVGIGTGIVLMQSIRVASAVSSSSVTRFGLALIAGFLCAIGIGLMVSQRLTRPLAEAAGAAHRLALGERDVRLKPEGPTEIAEIAEAINTLASELAISENRQRAFLTSVSHELRTPLTAIRGYAEGMSDGIVSSDDLVHVGEIIESESKRLDRLVADLLDLARSGAVDFPVYETEVDLAAVVADAAQVWQTRSQREGVVFISELPSSAVLVLTDAMRVRQIIDNLAENALRVTPTGARIVFTLTDSALLTISDGGPGLTLEDEKVAFQPGELFERYRGVRKVGTGFGLAIVGRLASRLGARASVSRAPEGGACFAIDFADVRIS